MAGVFAIRAGRRILSQRLTLDIIFLGGIMQRVTISTISDRNVLDVINIEEVSR